MVTPDSAGQTDDVLVRVDRVQKRFCRSLKRSLWYGVKDICGDLNPLASELVRPVLRTDEFWAVDDVSFQVRRGECVGLIGHNGAGKTTLLKMLNGLIKPDAGRIEMRGRVGALIALGAGFNPILTGRENTYVNGAVLGLSKREIDEKLDDIIEFADIGDFIDTPVQNYSSGMQVRLGFAIATAIEPEVLLLDEVLAVGDMAFRVKCYNRIGRMQQRAATILVTHDISYLSTVCNRVLFMSHGQGTYYEDRNAGIQRYIDAQTVKSTIEDLESLLTFVPPISAASIALGADRLQHGDDLVILLALTSESLIPNPQLRCTISTAEGHAVLVWDSEWTRENLEVISGAQRIRVALGPVHLTAGRYTVNISLTRPGNGQLVFYSHRSLAFEIVSKEFYSDIRTTLAVRSITVERTASPALASRAT